MKKITLSIILCSSLLVSNSFAADKLDEGVSQDHTFEVKTESPAKEQGIDVWNGWEISGDIRTGWVEYDYGNKDPGSTDNLGHQDSEGFYVMPKISISSPKEYKLRAKATVAAATDFGINNEAREARNFVFDPTDRESFAIVQEGYLSYIDGNHKVLIGREEITTPMIDSDDWYMLANSFELAYYTNTSLENMKFDIGYFSRMSGVWDSGDDGTEFNSMSDASFVSAQDKKNADDSGIFFGAFQYNDNKNHNLQVWEYYAKDLYNTLFIQYDYTDSIGSFNYDAGLQIIDFQGVGDLDSNNFTEINYTLYSARFDGSFDFGLNFATGISKYTDGEGQGATLGAFGGYPYFANGMIFHFFEAGSLRNAASYKAQLGYDLGKFGLKDTWIGYRYTYFDLDSQYSKNGDGKSQSGMGLNGVRISYGTNVGAYFTGTYESVDLDNEPTTYSLRLIGGYKF